MNLNIKNKKLLTIILTNVIILSQGSNLNEGNQKIKMNVNQNTKIESHSQENDFESIIEQELKEDIGDNIIECNNNVCSNKKIFLKEEAKKDGKIVKSVGKYQKLKQIGTTAEGWSLVKYDDKTGYVKSKNLTNIGDTYIEVDISEQKMTYYKDNEEFLTTDVVTGKDTTPTVKGLFKVYSKNTNYIMRGTDYAVHADYILKFYETYYIHDSDRTEFGGEIYHNDGSHGCVNTPPQKVKKIFNNTELNTKVLIHK